MALQWTHWHWYLKQLIGSCLQTTFLEKLPELAALQIFQISYLSCKKSIKHITLLLDPYRTYFWKNYVYITNKANLRDSSCHPPSNVTQIAFKSILFFFFFVLTFKFNRWPHKIIGYLFYAMSSFVHYFKAISQLKQKLHFGKAQFGSKSANFGPVWTWYLTDDLEK